MFCGKIYGSGQLGVGASTIRKGNDLIAVLTWRALRGLSWKEVHPFGGDSSKVQEEF